MSRLENVFELQLKAAGLLDGCEREYRFDTHRRWRFDFAWPEKLVAVEIEGGAGVGGRHTRLKGFDNDCEKYNAAAIAGWTILRGSARMVRSGALLVHCEQAIF